MALAAPGEPCPARWIEQDAEERYRVLFHGLDAGFCVVRLHFEDDRPVDYTFLEVNTAFEGQTGLVDPVGRRASELVPNLERHWFEIYGRVARTGEPVRFESGSDAMGRWFDVHAFRVGQASAGQVAIFFNDISARRAAERAARDSEERLQQALSAGQGIGTWDWDVKSDRVVADRRFAGIYGVDPDRAAAGAPIAAFFARIHPDDLTRVRDLVAETLGRGGEFTCEYRLVQEDGRITWVATQGICRLDEAGRAVRFPGVTFDVTQRKSAEMRQRALLEIADRLRDVSDPADLAYATAEVLGRTLGASRVGYGLVDPACEAITIERDWTAPGIESLAGHMPLLPYATFVAELRQGEPVVVTDAFDDSRAGDAAALLDALAARSVVALPVMEQGRLVALLYAGSAVPRPWQEDELSLMRDFSDRVRSATQRLHAERALQTSEDRFRGITNSVDQMIWSTRPDGHHDFFNDRWYAFTGVPYGSTDGEGWNGMFHPDDQDRAWEVWRRSLATGEPYRIEYRLRHRSGHYRWVLGRAQAVRDAEGRITRWFGTCTDIQEIVDAREVLARSREELERQVEARTRDLMAIEEVLRHSQKMEAVGQLTGGLAHDFNNLLAGITGSLELLSKRVAQGRFGELERYASAAQGAARRAAAVTHRLLAFSRRQTLDPKSTDVNALVAGMEDLICRTAGPAVALEIVAAPGLWPTLVDPNQLDNALLNLCINARDAMPDGGRLRIETANCVLGREEAQDRDLPPGEYVRLEVVDTGTGMTPEVIAKAFDPFFTTKPIGLGTGLGLSMVYGFARQSGGQIRIESRPGEGTAVSLHLPRDRSERPADEDCGRSGEAARAADGETVLIVDDEATIRMLVRDVLEDVGYAALEAADGAAGLGILRSGARIDLLITDVGLPGGMNGRQMADAARVTRPDLKVLFITGYAETGVVGHEHLAPGMHVMTKPFAMDALASRIRDLIAPG